MVVVAPSMLGADFGRLREMAELGAPISGYLHMDVMDGHFVPNLTMGPDTVSALKGLAPLDVHLMVTDPCNFIEPFTDAGAAMISVHVEANEAMKAIRMIKEKNIKSGIAIKPSTPLESVMQFLTPEYYEADMVLVMSVEPGFCGQKFHPEALERISKIREMKPEVMIEVDGGIGTENAKSVQDAGADILVAGSAIFNAEDPLAAAKKIAGLE